MLCLYKMCAFLLVARKSDQWFAVDPATGVKLHSFTPDGVLGTCPILTSPAGALYIGRSGKSIPILLYVYCLVILVFVLCIV